MTENSANKVINVVRVSLCGLLFGATTPSTTTRSIMTIEVRHVMLSIQCGASDCRYAERRYAERRSTFVVPLAYNISISLQANKLECFTSLTFAYCFTPQ
jgi:hypothetical protein